MNTQRVRNCATLSWPAGLPLVIVVCALAMASFGCEECKKDSDCGSGELCLGGSCKGGGSDGTDTGTSHTWPTDSSSATSSTDTTSNTGTGTDTGTQTSSHTDTDTTSHTQGTVTDTDTSACSEDSDCGVAPQCQLYACVNHECALEDGVDGQGCTAALGECMMGSCVSGECANAAPVSGIPCSDDNNSCTKDECRSGVCKHIAQPGQACADDSNECTQNICAADGTCGVSLNGNSCTYDTDPCTRDECSNKACIGIPINESGSCDDGLWCNGGEVCVLGTCTSTSPPCGAGTECSYYQCTEPIGGALAGTCGSLVNKTNGASCDDEVFCNGPDACQSGECTHGPLPCDGSGGGCTFEACDEELQECTEVNQQEQMPCPDEVLCDGTERCILGSCLGGLPYCPAINECQYEDCTENGDSPVCHDATYADNGALCSVSDPCAGTGTHRCVAGICAYGETAACQTEDQDNNFCTQWAGCTPLGENPSCLALVENALFATFGQGDPSTDSAPSSFTEVFSTVTSDNDVATYQNANCPGVFTGGEAIYKIPSEGAGLDVEAEIVTDASTNDAPLTLLLITNPCSPITSCLQMTTGTMTFTVPGSGNYYLVVDGLAGNRGTGSLTLQAL